MAPWLKAARLSSTVAKSRREKPWYRSFSLSKMHRSTCSQTAMNEGLSLRVSTATQWVVSFRSSTAWQKAK